MPDIKTKITSLLDELEKDAFKRGWSSALQNIVSNANVLSAEERKENTKKSSQEEKNRKYIARWHSIPWFILETAREANYDGITPEDVCIYAKKHGRELRTLPIFQSLWQMAKSDRVEKKHDFWYIKEEIRGKIEQQAENVVGKNTEKRRKKP